MSAAIKLLEVNLSHLHCYTPIALFIFRAIQFMGTFKGAHERRNEFVSQREKNIYLTNSLKEFLGFAIG